MFAAVAGAISRNLGQLQYSVMSNDGGNISRKDEARGGTR